MRSSERFSAREKIDGRQSVMPYVECVSVWHQRAITFAEMHCYVEKVMKKIRITEVGPRDGFQSLASGSIQTDVKLKIIEGLIAAGVQSIELTSFVSPKASPNMFDAEIITRTVLGQHDDLDLFAMVPNMRGLDSACSAGLKKVCYIVSLSEKHNMSNVNKTREQSFAVYCEMREKHPDMKIDLDVATAFGCPFDGKNKNIASLIEFLSRYVEAGVEECCLCDTVGLADPRQIEGFISEIRKAYPELKLSVHLHDTRGLGMVNAFAAIRAGVTDIQTSLGGLGGIPCSQNASGNLASEDLVWALHECGFETGIDCEKLVRLAREQAEMLRGNYTGHQIKIGI